MCFSFVICIANCRYQTATKPPDGLEVTGIVRSPLVMIEAHPESQTHEAASAALMPMFLICFVFIAACLPALLLVADFSAGGRSSPLHTEETFRKRCTKSLLHPLRLRNCSGVGQTSGLPVHGASRSSVDRRGAGLGARGPS